MAQSGLNKYDQEMQELHAAVEEEEKLWTELGMDPSKISFNMFLMNVKLMAVIDAVIDKLDVDIADVELAFKRRLLIELRESREMLTPAVRQAREQAIRVDPITAKTILDGTGKPIKH